MSTRPLQTRRRGYAQVRLHRAMSAQTVAMTPGAIVRLAYSLSPAPAEPSGVSIASHTQRAYARIEITSRVSASPRMTRIGGFSGSTPPSALSTKAPAMSRNATMTAAAWIRRGSERVPRPVERVGRAVERGQLHDGVEGEQQEHERKRAREVRALRGRADPCDAPEPAGAEQRFRGGFSVHCWGGRSSGGLRRRLRRRVGRADLRRRGPLPSGLWARRSSP